MDGTTERLDTVVIGGGQAGLATGYHLARLGVSSVIVDEQARVGDAWRTRWDSLRLFTPARFDGLPGMRFPADPWSFPTKDEMADYLETYAERFGLTVRTGVAVQRLERNDGGFALTTNRGRILADRVVVATGASRVPKVPPFAADLDPAIVQLHSSDYRNPSQLREGGVLVVGVGNSGAEIALELSAGRRTILAGAPSGQIPVEHGNRLPSRTGFRVVRFFGHHVVTRRNPLGRRLLPKLLAHGDPLVRTKLAHLEAAGVERVGRITGIRGGLPLVADDTTVDVENVVWATGFREDFPWIDIPILDGEGRPVHHRGLVDAAPGLAFVGLSGQFSLSSDVLPGRQRDAAYVAQRLAGHTRTRMGRDRSRIPLPA
jgi:putative flavoprotein involved in K+ transport